MIRDATAEDADEIAAIYNHYVQNTIITFEVDLVDADQMQSRIDVVQGAGRPWLVARDDASDALLGYAYAGQFRDRAAYNQTLEATVYLGHDAIGRGLGTALYMELIARLREIGTHVVIGTIALPNAASVALHEKLGFTQASHLHQVGWKFDSWIDVGHWELLLD